MKSEFEKIEDELVSSLDVAASVQKTESNIILARLSEKIGQSLIAVGIEAEEISLASGSMRSGQGERTALFNVKVDRGEFPVGVIYSLNGVDIEIGKIDSPEIRKAYNVSKYQLEINGEQFSTVACNKNVATGIIVDAILEGSNGIIYGERRYTKQNASLLKEALVDTVKVVESVSTLPEKKASLMIINESEYAHSEHNSFARTASVATSPIHELEKIALLEFEGAIDKESSNIRLAALSRQATGRIQEAIEALGLDAEVTADINHIDVDGKCDGVFNVSSDVVNGKFEFTAMDNCGAIDKVEFDKTVLAKYSNLREFTITLPDSDEKFRVTAKDERTACLELLAHLEEKNGPISFLGKTVTSANREVIAEEMLERCAIIERNVHAKAAISDDEIGTWRLEKAGENVVLMRE
jgi:hypothetical protein